MRFVLLVRKPEKPVKIRICEYRRNMRGRCPMSGIASHFWQSGAIRVADGTQGYVRANDTKESTGTAALGAVVNADAAIAGKAWTRRSIGATLRGGHSQRGLRDWRHGRRERAPCSIDGSVLLNSKWGFPGSTA